ncbi:MAG: homoserine dehydrogenase [Candidatus Levybacteria bacterium]|nr:homoserine dehydrogenase [Candidatus Levybacteria bacterium]
MAERIEGRPLGVGIVGAGEVGRHVIERAQQIGSERGYLVRRVAVRHPENYSGINAQLISDVEGILGDRSIDIFAELSGSQDALDWMKRAMAKGMGVVSANKRVIAGSDLINEAGIWHINLGIEASVGGGTTFLRPLVDRLWVDDLDSWSGIANGTTNFMFGGMSKGQNFDQVLEQAISRGFTERNHEADTQGYDAAQKLAIIAGFAFKALINPEQISRRGIMEITPFDLKFAREYEVDQGGPGYAVKLLIIGGRLDNGKSLLGVTPALVAKKDLLAQVDEEFNGFVLNWRRGGQHFIRGKGAGGVATAAAVNDDIDFVARNMRQGAVFEYPRQERLDSGLLVPFGVDTAQRVVEIQRPDGTSIRLPVVG